MKALIGAVLFSAALFSPMLAKAVTIMGGSSPSGSFFGITFGKNAGFGCFGGAAICNLANTILFIINFVLVPVLFAIAFIVFLWGVFKSYIWSRGEEAEVKKGHQLILWGLIGFAVMISIWGLVNVVASTFGLVGYSAPPLPQSR